MTIPHYDAATDQWYYFDSEQQRDEYYKSSPTDKDNTDDEPESVRAD